MSKNIVLVGGNSGIGAELAERLVSAGNQVHVVLRKPSEVLEGVASSQYYDARDGAESSLQLPEVIDAMVYCPGTIALKPFNRVSADDMREDMEVNAFGAARMIQVALAGLKKSQVSSGASVVMFSSVAAQTGLAFHSSISMAKAAVEGLTVSLASELASSGIRVNAVAPSLTDTPLAGALLDSEAKRDACAGRHPLKRVGEASGVAGIVEYLLGEDSAFVTGQIFKLDGGLSSIR